MSGTILRTDSSSGEFDDPPVRAVVDQHGRQRAAAAGHRARPTTPAGPATALPRGRPGHARESGVRGLRPRRASAAGRPRIPAPGGRPWLRQAGFQHGVGAADAGVAGEGQFLARGEDAHAIAGFGLASAAARSWFRTGWSRRRRPASTRCRRRRRPARRPAGCRRRAGPRRRRVGAKSRRDMRTPVSGDVWLLANVSGPPRGLVYTGIRRARAAPS